MDDNNSDDNQLTITNPTEPVEPVVSEESKLSIMMNLESLIKSHMSQLRVLREDLTKHKSMLNDIFENDSTYKAHAEAAKEAAKIKSATKAQIMKQPSVASLAEKVKSLQSQTKELDEALSDYLREYNTQTGITEIEGEDGTIQQIVYVAKLVRKPH